MLRPGDVVPDFEFVSGPGKLRKLEDFGQGPWALIFLRHLA